MIYEEKTQIYGERCGKFFTVLWGKRSFLKKGGGEISYFRQIYNPGMQSSIKPFCGIPVNYTDGNYTDGNPTEDADG